MAATAGHGAGCAQQAAKVVGGGAGRCGGGARGGRGRPRGGRRGGETAPCCGSAAINPVPAAAPARPPAWRGPTGGPGAARPRSRSPAAVSGLGASGPARSWMRLARWGHRPPPRPLGERPAGPRVPAGRFGAGWGRGGCPGSQLRC